MASNAFVTLPAPSPAGNGTGAAVDVSGMGVTKTLSVGSSNGAYQPNIYIEASQDGVHFHQVASFQGPNEQTIEVACHYMRQVVANYVAGIGVSNPSVGVGGDSTGVGFTTLPALSSNGSAAGVGTSNTNAFKSVQVTSTFSGTVNIDISEDGGVTYNTVMTFIRPGIQSMVFAADHMRVTRSGYQSTSPGTPTVVVSDGILAGSGSFGFERNVQYTAAGGESSFTVNWATPFASASSLLGYAGGGGLTNVQAFDVPTTSLTTTSALVKCSGPLTMGDLVNVQVLPKSS